MEDYTEKIRSTAGFWSFCCGRGGYTNAEIGEAFGVNYTAVRHIVQKDPNESKS